jgi:protease IV
MKTCNMPPSSEHPLMEIFMSHSNFLALILIPFALSGCFSADRQLHAQKLPGEGSGSDQVLIVDIHGAISNDRPGGFGGDDGAYVEDIREQLRMARRSKVIKAVVLAIDSPGGEVTASDIIHGEVVAIRKAGKPVVAHMGPLCASGGYYIACAADQIVASPTSITGSIGVIFMAPDLHRLMEDKLGVTLNTIKSGKYKDIASPARAMSDEERKLLQDLIDGSYRRFVSVVVAGRKGRGPIPADTAAAEQAVKTLADGRIYSGEDAVTNGLADANGQLFDAVREAKHLAKLKKAAVVRYERDDILFSIMAADAGSKSVNVNSGVQINAHGLVSDLKPRLQYRWAPTP